MKYKLVVQDSVKGKIWRLQACSIALLCPFTYLEVCFMLQYVRAARRRFILGKLQSFHCGLERSPSRIILSRLLISKLEVGFAVPLARVAIVAGLHVLLLLLTVKWHWGSSCVQPERIPVIFSRISARIWWVAQTRPFKSADVCVPGVIRHRDWIRMRPLDRKVWPDQVGSGFSVRQRRAVWFDVFRSRHVLVMQGWAIVFVDWNSLINWWLKTKGWISITIGWIWGRHQLRGNICEVIIEPRCRQKRESKIGILNYNNLSY